MGGTLFVLTLTLVITLTSYLKQLRREERRYHALFSYSDLPTLFITPDNTIYDLNESALTLLGYSRKQLKGQKWYEKLLPDEQAVQIRHALYRSLKQDARTTLNAPLIRNNGQSVDVDYTFTRLPQQPKGYLLTLVDLTDNTMVCEELIVVKEQLHEAKTALRQLDEQFKVTFDIAINGIAILDSDGRFSYINRALIEMYEYNEDYLRHLGIRLLLNDEESAQALLDTAKRGEKIDKMHIRAHTRSGEPLDIDLTMGYLPELRQYYMVIQDITKTLAYTTALQLSKENLEQRVVKDYLTKAYNRAYLEERLEQLMQIEHKCFGLILLDIDHFKKVNDTYGHLVGDDVLVHLVEALKGQLRRGDTLARFGGEEFIILLPEASHEQTLNIAYKLQHYIAALDFENCPNITCSFGVESFDGAQDKRTLLLSADNALYKAKASGRNTVIDAHTLTEHDYSI